MSQFNTRKQLARDLSLIKTFINNSNPFNFKVTINFKTFCDKLFARILI